MAIPMNNARSARALRPTCRRMIGVIFVLPALLAEESRGAPAAAAAVTNDAAATRQLDQRWRGVSAPHERFSTREFFAFALDSAAANWHPERLEVAFANAEKKQDLDPASKTFGNFAWYWNDERPDDRNAVEFCMQRAVLVWMHHRDRLTPAGRAALERVIAQSVEGLRRHKVSVRYTNIFLMKIWNCIAIGESTGRPDLAREGQAMLDEWLATVRREGVHEYLSPTYYAVDLECLGLLANHAQDPAVRAQAARAMDLLWADTAANWFTPADRLGGAHSRDYDYVTGRGGLNTWAAWGGLAGTNEVQPGAVFDRLAYRPPAAAIRRLPAVAPRLVQQRWGSNRWNTAVQWVGRSVAVGSAGAGYHDAMDKTLVVLFPGAQTPGVTFFMDARGDPYGQNKQPTGGGHLKSFHVQPFVHSVQRESEVLLLASAQAGGAAFRRSGSNLTCLLSHLMLPANAELFVGADGGPVTVTNRLHLPNPDTPVFLRMGEAAAGLRFVRATTPDGAAAPVELVADGGKVGALRLTAVHAESAPTGRVAVVCWARAAEGLDDRGFAAFRADFARARADVAGSASNFIVTAAGRVSELRLRADLVKELPLEARGGSPGTGDFILAVNGRELAGPLLDAVNATETRP